MTKHVSLAFDDTIFLPLVEKIRERVRKGELEKKYLEVAEYMTDPAAPFPIKDGDLVDFFNSMRADGIAASDLKNG